MSDIESKDSSFTNRFRLKFKRFFELLVAAGVILSLATVFYLVALILVPFGITFIGGAAAILSAIAMVAITAVAITLLTFAVLIYNDFEPFDKLKGKPFLKWFVLVILALSVIALSAFIGFAGVVGFAVLNATSLAGAAVATWGWLLTTNATLPFIGAASAMAISGVALGAVFAIFAIIFLVVLGVKYFGSKGQTENTNQIETIQSTEIINDLANGFLNKNPAPPSQNLDNAIDKFLKSNFIINKHIIQNVKEKIKESCKKDIEQTNRKAPPLAQGLRKPPKPSNDLLEHKSNETVHIKESKEEERSGYITSLVTKFQQHSKSNGSPMEENDEGALFKNDGLIESYLKNEMHMNDAETISQVKNELKVIYKQQVTNTK